jgi:ATP-dependent DNA helicase RecQ
LQLREKGRQVLAGSEGFMLRADSVRSARPSAKAKKRAAEVGVDAALLARLKAVRRELAEIREVPAYIIFSDATLIDMCHLRPETLEQMALVSGVGPKKLEDFGQAFLDALVRRD